MTWVNGGEFNVEIDGENVIFTEKDIGSGVLECLEFVVCYHDYIYYHCGDDSKIVISKKDYTEYVKDCVENGFRY